MTCSRPRHPRAQASNYPAKGNPSLVRAPLNLTIVPPAEEAEMAWLHLSDEADIEGLPSAVTLIGIPTQIYQSGDQDSWIPASSILPKKLAILLRISDVWRRLGDFGCHFGCSWAPRGSQNPKFWDHDAEKSKKMRSRKGSLKKH